MLPIAGPAHVDTVRRFMAAIRRGDVGAACTLLHREFVVSEAGGLPYSGDYFGPEGFTQLLMAMTDALQLTAGPSVQDLLPDHTVVSRFRLTFRSRATGRKAEIGVVELYTFRDGLIVGLDVYYKDPAAVTALMRPTGPRPHDEYGPKR